jgi:hypothetical protein
MQQTNIANLPLHGDKVPAYLFYFKGWYSLGGRFPA